MARKRKKKNPSNISLSQVLVAFNNKDYGKADQLLKKTKVRYEQAGLAKQLKIELRHQQALLYFKEESYQSVIDLLSANFAVQAKDDFPLAIEKTHILIGLSQAYLMNFEEAAKHLAESTKHEHTHSIVFYYLLSLLFLEKTETLNMDSFSKNHQKHIPLLEEHQKNYLKAAFYMRIADWERSLKILKQIPQKSHIQQANLNALIHICEEKQFESPSSPIKSLYKAILDLEFSPNNRNYLSLFDIFKPKISQLKTEKKDDKLKQQLEQLCITGRALPEVSFNNCMNACSEESHPYIVYNQIACLATHLNSVSIPKIQKILKNYKQHFFTIPESILLYIKILNKQRRQDRPAVIFNNFNLYLKNFYELLPIDQLNYIGWQILFYLRSSSLDNNLGVINELNKLSKAYPNIVAIKWNIISESIHTKLKDTQHTADFLSLKHLAYNEKGIIKDFTFFLEAITIKEEDPFGFGFIKKKNIRQINASLKKTIAILSPIFHHPEINTDSILGFKLIQRIKILIFDLVLEGRKVDEKLIAQLKSDYLHLINIFGGAEKNPDAYKDYQTMDNLTELGKIQEALYGPIRNVEKLIKEGHEKLLCDVIIKQINQRHFTDEEASNCLKIFKAYVNVYQENAIEKMEHFLDRFDNECTDEGCGCDVKFIHELLIMAAKEKADKYSIITLLVTKKVNINFIVPDVFYLKLIPEKYNNAIKILMSLSKVKNFYHIEPNKKMIKEIMDYLKYVISKKKLKGLTEKYNKAKQIFDY